MASERLGEEVRQQGQKATNSDLVFNPETGEFEINGSGDVVTKMSEDGFA